MRNGYVSKLLWPNAGLVFQPIFWACMNVFVCAQSLQLRLTLFMGILQSRMLEWWPCLPPGNLPSLGIEPASLMSPAWTGGFFTTSAQMFLYYRAINWKSTCLLWFLLVLFPLLSMLYPIPAASSPIPKDNVLNIVVTFIGHLCVAGTILSTLHISSPLILTAEI